MIEAGKFAGVGLLATLVHVAAAFAVHTGLGLAPQLANLFGFAASVLISYFGHARFTFQVSANHPVHFPRFVTLAFLGLLVSSSTTYVAVDHLGVSFAAAMGIVALCVPAATFVGAKLWAFDENARTATGPMPGIVLCFAMAGLFLWAMWGRIINHDTAWYIYATREWLNGARLYVDIVEVNPPLNFYLTIPAIWASDYLNLSAINAQYFVISGLAAGSLSWVWLLLQTHSTLSHSRQVGLIAGTALILTGLAVSGIGQREHIMMMLIAPYLFGILLIDDPDTGWGGLSRALVAAIGICIKPHFVLFPLVLTLARMAQRRTFAPIWSRSNVTIVLVGALYVLLVRVLHPEYLDTIVPIAMHVYGDYGFGTYFVITKAAPHIILLFAIATLLLWKYREMPANGIILISAVIAAILIYAAQWTGYRYQAFPIMALIALFAVWSLAHARAFTVPACLLIMLLCAITLQSIRTGLYPSLSTPQFEEALEDAGPNPSFMVFSTALSPAFPLVVETDARWTSRYPALWLVPGAVNGLNATDCTQDKKLCDDYAAILATTRHDIVSDFVTGSPDVLVFDKRHRYIQQRDFDYSTFLKAEPGYIEHFSQYKLRTSFDAFEIWEKK